MNAPYCSKCSHVIIVLRVGEHLSAECACYRWREGQEIPGPWCLTSAESNELKGKR